MLKIEGQLVAGAYFVEGGCLDIISQFPNSSSDTLPILQPLLTPSIFQLPPSFFLEGAGIFWPRDLNNLNEKGWERGGECVCSQIWRLIEVLLMGSL